MMYRRSLTWLFTLLMFPSPFLGQVTETSSAGTDVRHTNVISLHAPADVAKRVLTEKMTRLGFQPETTDSPHILLFSRQHREKARFALSQSDGSVTKISIAMFDPMDMADIAKVLGELSKHKFQSKPVR